MSGAAPVAVAVLAGGQARRMGGVLKPALDVGGRSVIDRLRQEVGPLAAALFLVGDPVALAPLGLEVVPDRRPGEGPLAGLEAALAHAARLPGEAMLLLGGDMPFLQRALLERLLAADPAADVACFESARGPEPLCARYHLRLLPTVSALLDQGRRAMQALFDTATVARLPLRDERERLALTNLNTADDLALARALASSID